jgi:hypothetical protein
MSAALRASDALARTAATAFRSYFRSPRSRDGRRSQKLPKMNVQVCRFPADLKICQNFQEVIGGRNRARTCDPLIKSQRVFGRNRSSECVLVLEIALQSRRVVRTLGRASSFQTRRSLEGSKTPILMASSKPYFQVKVQSFRERGAPESGFRN